MEINMNGNGKMINQMDIKFINFSVGNKYEGEWKNNNLNEYGIKYYLNGVKYEGQRKNGIFEGYGIYYYLDGTK